LKIAHAFHVKAFGNWLAQDLARSTHILPLHLQYQARIAYRVTKLETRDSGRFEYAFRQSLIL
jgi:hypothetical protein